MNIFDIHSNIIGAYAEYIRSFVNINGLMVSLEAKKHQDMEEFLRNNCPCCMKFWNATSWPKTSSRHNKWLKSKRKTDLFFDKQ